MTTLNRLILSARSRKARSGIIGAMLLAAAAFMLWFQQDSYPIREWLFPSYLLIWALIACFLGSSLVAGWWLLGKLSETPLRLPERLLLSLTLGVLLFYLAMFGAGVLHLYTPVTFAVVPILLLALGLPKVLQDVTRLRAHLRRFGWLLILPRRWPSIVAAVFFTVCVVGVYLQIMLPRNIHADSHWYHLPIAEYYVAARGIVRFPEGWYVGSYPQLASILYTWAFLTPGSLFTHVLLCAHLDFVLFIATVLGVSVLAARLLGVRHLSFAGATVFLFPGLFVYDSSVTANADHILAFWVPALGIALLRFAKHYRGTEAVVAGLVLAGAACTKYQAVYVVVPATLLVTALAIRYRRVKPAFVWMASLGIITATHWLKNLVYYHDPLYPLLNAYLPSTPFYNGAAELIAKFYWLDQFAAKGPLLTRLWDAIRVVATFAFIPNDWGFHGTRPIFGFLFTLVFPALFFVKAPLRVWLLFLGTQLGIIVWYLTSHQDRFLQSLLPWMAAATACVLVLAWRKGRAARVGVTVVVLAQWISGLDVYFIKAHNMVGDSPFRATGNYLAAGQAKEYAGRTVIDSTHEKIAAAIPKDATILLHTYMGRLGIGTKIVADWRGWQGAIEYLQQDSPAQTADLMRRLGVTHLMRHGEPGGLDLDDMARELVFLRFFSLYEGRERHFDDATVAPFMPGPADVNLAHDATRIAWLSCQGAPPPGLYSPRQLDSRTPIRSLSLGALRIRPEDELKDANAVALHRNCPSLPDIEAALGSEFARRANAGTVSLWVRKRSHTAPTAPTSPAAE